MTSKRDLQDSEIINSVEFIDQREKLLFANAQLGEQARDFLTSPVGRYLHGRAKELADQAREEALDIHPWTPFTRRKLAKAREKAAHASHFIKWCADIIIEGDQALTQLEEYRV